MSVQLLNRMTYKAELLADQQAVQRREAVRVEKQEKQCKQQQVASGGPGMSIFPQTASAVGILAAR